MRNRKMTRGEVSMGCWNSVPRKEAQARRHTRKDLHDMRPESPINRQHSLGRSREQVSVQCTGALTLSVLSGLKEGDVWKCWAPWCR